MTALNIKMQGNSPQGSQRSAVWADGLLRMWPPSWCSKRNKAPLAAANPGHMGSNHLPHPEPPLPGQLPWHLPGKSGR